MAFQGDRPLVNAESNFPIGRGEYTSKDAEKG
jgi:hypothetical protein